MKMIFLDRSAVLLALVLLMAGCDVFRGEATVVRGVVLDAQTQQPLAGIDVYLEGYQSGFTAQRVLVNDVTDARGRFYLKTRDPRPSGVYANASFYTFGHYRSEYLQCAGDVREGEDQTVTLRLKLVAKPSTEPCFSD